MRQDTELENCMRIPVQGIQNKKTHCRRYCSSSTNTLKGTQNNEGTATWDDT